MTMLREAATEITGAPPPDPEAPGPFRYAVEDDGYLPESGIGWQAFVLIPGFCFFGIHQFDIFYKLFTDD
jgi:hypothetical protein